jgi:methionine sulfoxide reductase heme-binding subunit
LHQDCRSITLAVTPVRRLTARNDVIRFRRMLGMFAFFYGTLHLATYVIADRFAGLDFSNGIVSWTTAVALAHSVVADIDGRPFITIGVAAWTTMLPLAITSTAGWIRGLGGRNWNRLHRLIYATGILAPLHYWWLVKADVRRPLTYAAIVLLLLAFRLAKMGVQRAVRTSGPVREAATLTSR